MILGDDVKLDIDSIPTILILALIGIALFAALRSMKKHPSGCSGHCSGCPVQCKSEKHR